MKQIPTKKIHFQRVRFGDVEELIEFLPEDELRVFSFLRRIVLDCLPQCTEKLSYNVPFYKKNRGICFLWPASVTWGEKVTYRGVRLGFNYGHLLADELNYLDKGQRKQVYWRDFTKTAEIDVDLVRSYLFEAELIDREFKR